MSKWSKIIIWNVCLYFHMWTRLWIIFHLTEICLKSKSRDHYLSEMHSYDWLSYSFDFEERLKIFLLASFHSGIIIFLYSLSDFSLYKEQKANRIQLWHWLNCSLFFNFMFMCVYVYEWNCAKMVKGWISFVSTQTKQKQNKRIYFFMAMRIWWIDYLQCFNASRAD